MDSPRPPVMHPAPGSRQVAYVGDRCPFSLKHPKPGQNGWRAFLRTNLTRASRAREETVALAGSGAAGARIFAGASWRDIPLNLTPDGWTLNLPLTEVGFFRAKAYAVDPEGRQHWPEGKDLGLSVLPGDLRTCNTIYCAFPRLFGGTRDLAESHHPVLEAQFQELDARGHTVIPPSGKLRDLTRVVPHIMGDLGCRILHLLPLGPTPTTYARMGRYGSPYAQLDLTGIDPALVDFDRRTTAEDQFRELSYAIHLRGGLLFLDIVVNHTGWGSRLMQQRPDWFQRDPDGAFHSPGAWGVTWGDLVELDHQDPELWEEVASALITWCERGVDGFRCDAGYMVPLPAWQFIIARVRQSYPDAVFLLEGLGGAWEATEALLTEGGMQWAYSELFQNFEPRQVSGYLDHALLQSKRMGPLVHYSETHDNERLAKKGRTWSLLRNRLCALASVSGAYGFTCGVEWLAQEKIDVHQSRGLNWGAHPNLLRELASLNRLLGEHPCFFDEAQIQRLSPEDTWVLALERTSAEGLDHCLVLLNLDPEGSREVELPREAWERLGQNPTDLLAQGPSSAAPQMVGGGPAHIRLRLEAGLACCLSPLPYPAGLAGDAYRQARAQAAFALVHLAQVLGSEGVGAAPWQALAALVDRDAGAFLGALSRLDPAQALADLPRALDRALALEAYPPVVRWRAEDLRRVLPVPPDHWLLVEDPAPFAVSLHRPDAPPLHLKSTPAGGLHILAFFPRELETEAPRGLEAELHLDRFREVGRPDVARLRLLSRRPRFIPQNPDGLALLTNGRGAMVRLHGDLGHITSKYDCLLGANLHPDRPCDRHIFAKRLRAWINADGFLTALDRRNLVQFEMVHPAQASQAQARWRFRAHAGDGRTVEIRLAIALVKERNTVLLSFERGPGEGLPPSTPVRLSLRLDLEDRSFHGETRRDEGLDAWFRHVSQPFEDRPGFRFAPAPDRHLVAFADRGAFHCEPEWCQGISHPVEAERGMAGEGDAWSPGWFDLDLTEGTSATLCLSADPAPPAASEIAQTLPGPLPSPGESAAPEPLALVEALRRASRAFLARRDGGATVIAGYPWFLDWGRDALIACRGLLAGGETETVRNILLTYARLEDRGTLPNMLSAESTANRETSDAPLFFGLACQEAATHFGPELYAADAGGRSLGQVLLSIAQGYLDGTPFGVHVDRASGLVWSPSHFTWMDTNHPACTPREGYPVELQALWLRLLAQANLLDPSGPWQDLAGSALRSLELYWNETGGWCHDTLLAPNGQGAEQAHPDGHLRPNQLWLVALGLFGGSRARRLTEACARHLLVPGALRTLAPLPVRVPLGQGGRHLKDPEHPYCGRYSGDEDTQRKPAYHNGTAWPWQLPLFCEALAAAWDFDPGARAAAKSYLGSVSQLLHDGCLGQLPELLDGDAPHAPKGCDAQAWSATEALRVTRLLEHPGLLD